MVNKIWMRYKGEGTTHTNMRWFIRDAMLMIGWEEAHMNYPIHHYDPFSENEWIRRNKYGKLGVYHEWDVVGVMTVPSVDGMVQFKQFTELDGEWHNTKEQQNKDKTAEEALIAFYAKHHEGKNYKIVRIKKPLILDAMKNQNIGYLRQNFLTLPFPEVNAR